MNFRLPELASRGRSPTHFLNKSKNPRPISSFSTLKPRLDSNSPMRKDSNESIFNIRTISDDVNSAKSSQSSVLSKLNTLLVELDKKSLKKSVRPRLLKNKQKMYKEVAKALFKLTNTTKNKIQAASAASLFISLGYTSNYESLCNMFKSVYHGESFSMISFGKSDVMSIFEDSKVDNILRVLLKEFKEAEGLEKDEEFDYLITIIHRWWVKLDISKNGFVGSEDICKFLIKENMFDSSVELKKIFHKSAPFLNFQQFFTIFAKALFKFLLLRLCDDSSANGFVPPDIVINEKRRKLILDGISGQNRTFETLNKFRGVNKE